MMIDTESSALYMYFTMSTHSSCVREGRWECVCVWGGGGGKEKGVPCIFFY